MTSEEEVKLVCGQLVQVIEIMTDPSVSQTVRIEAFEKCENFKRTSPIVVQCGLALGQPTQNPVVRHFGLKILEDIIRLRWNEMSLEQKVFIKESVMQLVESGTNNLMLELPHIKDGISRLVVEIMKREWPQQWPTLLQELDQLCRKGETQTEMVMMVMLRLVEDVAVLQTLEQTQRRKEIYQALTANMEEIFRFLLQLLEKHYQGYLAYKRPGAVATAAVSVEANILLGKQHCKVCQAILLTFSAFVEWVAMSHIMANDRYLIRCLCHLLSDDDLQLYAAECLLSIVSWKSGKAQDRMQLLSLFGSDMMAPLFEATERANQRTLDEDHYNFLKKMVQILVELGTQLCALWTKDGTLWVKEVKDRRPQNFNIYLNALLAFANHSSQTVNLYVNELWVKFFRHADISTDDVFRTYIPQWVNLAVKKCVKTGLPSRNDSPSCAYALLDFDNDEEFLAFFGRYRIILLEGFKLISADTPSIPFQPVELWLKEVLGSPANFGRNNIKCTVTSPTYTHLDAIANLLDAILAKLSKEQMMTILNPSLSLAKMCLDYQSSDPVLMSALLSCVSSLFVAVGTIPSSPLLMPTLNKIFSCITFSDGSSQDGNKISNSCKMLRRHGCALMVKLATRQPEVLLPIFTHLRDTVVSMKAQKQIFEMEFATLVEALVLISNELKNFQLQSGFIKAIAEPICRQFCNLEAAFQCPASFIEFVGLTRPSSTSEEDPSRANRSEICYTLTFLLSVCRRSACPSELEACRSGGFILSQSQEFIAMRNPAWEMAASVLRHVFMLTRTMNHLWAAETTSKLHPDFAQALGILESERNTITGIGNRERNQETKLRTPLSRMQTFLFEIYENNYHFISQLCSSCGYEFYQTPQLSNGIVSSVIEGVNFIPDYRLRAIIRMFLKSLINKCPKSCFASVLAPVFRVLCPYMLTRLTDRWKYLATLRESPTFDENNTDSQEVIDDVVCRHLAREYLDVVKAILSSGGGSDIALGSVNNGGDNGGGGSGGGGSESNDGAASNKANILALSELGRHVMQDAALGQSIILTLLQALVWPDSPSSIRAANLLELVLPVLVQSGHMSDADASQVMINILSAIHELGQHEANNIVLTQLAIQAYEWLRPSHPSVVDVLAQVPGCNPEDLKRFDDRMMAIINGKENMKGGDRTKKDMFRKLISQFIGKDVGKMFKHEVVIKNLPTLQNKPRHKTPSLDDMEKSDIGICSLFAQNGNQI